MKHIRVPALSFAAVFSPLVVMSAFAGLAVSLAGALPARGGEVPFTERLISTTADQAFSVFATDLDGDGDTDVLSTSQFDGKIAWYQSDGGLPPTFTERVIVNLAESPQSVFATDVDGDGDTDVLSASAADDEIAWYENTSPPPPIVPLLRLNVVQSQIAGPPYPTAESIRVDVLGEFPPDPILPVEQLTLSLEKVFPPDPVLPLPIELVAVDNGGGADLSGDLMLVKFNWQPAPEDSFPPDPIHFQLTVRLLSAGNGVLGFGAPPDDGVPAPTAFDVTFDSELRSAAPRGVASGDLLATAGHTLHFEIGAGQPIEFSKVVVGPIDPLDDDPTFPISFFLAKTGAEDPDKAMPLLSMTMVGTFEPPMSNVPAVSQWGMAVMLLLVLSASRLIVLKRRNALS